LKKKNIYRRCNLRFCALQLGQWVLFDNASYKMKQ